MPKDESPPTVVVAVNEKGWMNEEMMTIWLTKCYTKRPDGYFKTRKALLVMDSMRAHITPQFKDKIKACNSIPVIIPGGLTKILQPLDISVNRSFKAVLRRLWEEWMVDGEHSFAATGRMRRATFQQVLGWIDTAWKSVTIRSAFRKAGITGTDAESDDSPAEEERALHLPPELAELFRSDTEDEEFDGFCFVE
ncbi:hypothetical protein DPEC_G00158260 [Dallia pectoralis]|uniref:Uncharacterized protein n=1 Tax=Dallia pectoralis TaxID=75939 RepID=A0ACC2GLF3_DALPE|nr:hypothetical protein DPEC_G00158260 [Dallia pectoralis]